MSKMSDLSLTLDELKRCGEVLIGISESLRDIFSAPDPEAVEENKQQNKESAAKKEKPVTFEEVRAVLARKTWIW